MTIASEKPAPPTPAKRSGLGETVKIVVQALVLAVIFRTFLFQPFYIESGSMKDTLLIGDYLFVAKFAYGYSRYSLPVTLPLPEGRVFAQEPHRGDIVLFKLPSDNSTDYIKRLVGLPGDTIQVRHSILYINDVAVPRIDLGKFTDPDDDVTYTRYRETLPNGVSYVVLDRDPDSFEDNTELFRVPAGHYFMMGDNRDNSSDSRFPSTPGGPGVGYVPFDNLVGPAKVIFFSVQTGENGLEFWKWPWTVRWDRLLHLT
jgi:signal peptidase I